MSFFSLFAGAMSDRWDKKRTLLVCDTLADLGTLITFVLFLSGRLTVGCLYALNALNGLMNTNLGALLRSCVPLKMQGRVYAVRNTFQFFTIPIGYLLGGVLVDRVFEPFMAFRAADSLLVRLFGSGKGTGAAFLFLLLAVTGEATCLIFRRDRHIWALEKTDLSLEKTDGSPAGPS